MNKHISKAQFFILLVLTVLLAWSVIHVTVLNGYYREDSEYSAGVSAFSESSAKKSLDVLETVFHAERTYIDRVNLLASDLPEDRKGYLNIRLEHRGRVIYTGNKHLSAINPNEWFSVRLGISLKPGDLYRIVITAKDTSSPPSVYLADDGKTPVLTYTYKEDLSNKDKAVIIGRYLVLFLISFALTLKYHEIIAGLTRLAGWLRCHSNKSVLSAVGSVAAAIAVFGSVYLVSGGKSPFTDINSSALRAVDKTLLTACCLIFCLACIYIVWQVRKITAWLIKILDSLSVCGWRIGLYSVANTLASALVLKFSKLTLSDDSFFYLLVVSVLISSVWLENKFRKIRSEFFSTARNRIVYILLSLYTAFSIVGSSCFIYPINKSVSTADILCFAGMSITVFPLVVWLTYLLGFCCRSEYVRRNGNMPWKVYFLCFGIILFVALCYMRAFNPAISSPDSLSCLGPAINSIRGIINWHPPFYILWLKAIVRIWNSTYAVLLVHYVWFSFVFLEGMRFLYRRGLSSGWIILVTLLTALNCGNMVQLTTIWKDIPYTISVLWLTVLIARFVLENQSNKWLIYIEFVTAMICTAFMRQNGIVIFVILVLALFFLFRKNWKMRSACAISAVMAVLINFPLYTYLGIKSDEGGGKFVGLGQDIKAAYFSGGTLSDSAMHVVSALSENNLTGFAFNPYMAQNYSYQSFSLKVPEFIGAYADTFIRNPVLMTREIFTRQDGIWNLLAAKDGGMNLVNFIYTLDGYANWNSLVPQRHNNLFTEKVSQYTAQSASVLLLNMIEWRTGIWTLIAVLAFAVSVILKDNSKLCLLFAVELGHILSLVLSLAWSDYRYYWPLTLVSLFLILTVLTVQKHEKTYF